MNKETQEKKQLSKEELLAKYRSTLIVLRMKSKMGQLVQTHQMKELKKRNCSLAYCRQGNKK